MAERAHPDDPAFRDQWRFSLKKGFIPWFDIRRSPYRAAFMWRYQWVSAFCSGKVVLDVPCGMGWGTSMICGAKSIIGLDICKDAIEEATARYGHHAKFQVGDMCQLDIPDAGVDVVCCLEGIEHVPLEVGRAFLSEANRVLRPGGRLLISSPYCKSMPHSGNPFHIHEYGPEEIRGVLGEYFSIEKCETRDVDIMTVLYLNCRKNQ